MNDCQAIHYEALTNGGVRCLLCPHYCEIQQEDTGICGVRKNHSGKLVAKSYAKVNGLALDPIEKKPLHFFHPGSMILSVGTYGCNLDCTFCQNHKSVRQANDGDVLMPDELVKIAQKYTSQGNIGVAYTYNEPVVGYEYVYLAAKLVKSAGLKNVLVTNGFINPEPLGELLPFVDAMNIDLKGFTQGFYGKLGGKLETVKQTITKAVSKCHVEVTMLVIPDENDEDIEEVAKWLASVDPKTPLHLSRFFPRYKYASREPTPVKTLKHAESIAKKHLTNVVLGNV